MMKFLFTSLGTAFLAASTVLFAQEENRGQRCRAR